MSYHEDFKNKTVLVTGGSRGIGRAIVESLLSYGADVTVLARNPQNLTDLQKSHPSIKTICVDLGDWSKTSEVLSASQQTFEFLVNCAGTCAAETFLNSTPTNYRTTFDLNVGSVFSVSQFVAKGMISTKQEGDKNRIGAIVNISSLASKIAFPLLAMYSCSKAALDMLTKCMAVELGPHGIRVNSVNCSGVDTDLAREVGKAYGKAMEEFGADFAAGIKPTPLTGPDGGDGGMVGMEPVVEVVLFLLSPRTSGATTGQLFFVDNGYSAI